MVGRSLLGQPIMLNLGPADTDPNAGPVDPLAALEKSTDAQKHMNTVQIPRLEALQSVSDHYSSDPYSHSLRVRKRFRQEKKFAQEKEKMDTKIKDIYALPETLLLAEETEETSAAARQDWLKGRQEMRDREGLKRRRSMSSIEIVPSQSSRAVPVKSVSHSTKNSAARVGTVASLRSKILENTARHRGPLASTAAPKKPSGVKNSFRQ